MDLRAQMERIGPLGGFPAGADETFFRDLEEFLTIAHQEPTNGPLLPSIGGSTDTHDLIRAVVKAKLFDQCQQCNEIDRIKAVLNAEQRV
jgi:hypothetical protein